MVVGKNHRLIQNPVEHLRWSAFAKIINGQKLLTIFAKSSIVDVQLGLKYASRSESTQRPEFFCECLMQILNSFSSHFTHLNFQFSHHFCTQFLITGWVFHVEEKETYLLYDSRTAVLIHLVVTWRLQLLFGESQECR